MSRSKPSRFELHLTGPKGKAGGVTAGSVEAGNEAGLDGVGSHPKDDRDRRSCLLGGESRNISTDTNKDSNFSADQIGRQSWQPIVIAIRPTELNPDSLAFDKARFRQTLSECGDEVRRILRCSATHEADYRHCRLLRTCGKRPCGRNAPPDRP